jgi:hypothetical protein
MQFHRPTDAVETGAARLEALPGLLMANFTRSSHFIER